MELKVFGTLVKEDREYCHEYVCGRIAGIGYMILGCENTNGWNSADDGSILVMRCTQEQYDRFTEIIEELYPNLCEFNWMV